MLLACAFVVAVGVGLGTVVVVGTVVAGCIVAVVVAACFSFPRID